MILLEISGAPTLVPKALNNGSIMYIDKEIVISLTKS